MHQQEGRVNDDDRAYVAVAGEGLVILRELLTLCDQSQSARRAVNLIMRILALVEEDKNTRGLGAI
jgi:hypothetical protein